MVDEQVFPHFHVARNVGPPVRLHAQPLRQQHHVGIGTEHRPCGAGAGDTPLHSRIETDEPFRLQQVVADRPVDAANGVVQTRHPTIVARQQLLEKRRAVLWRRARQFLPRGDRPRAAGHHSMPVADLEHAAVKIEHMRKGLQSCRRHLLLQIVRSLTVQLREAQIKPAQRGVGKKKVDEFSALLFLRRSPEFLAVKHRYHRRLVVVAERLIGS